MSKSLEYISDLFQYKRSNDSSSVVKIPKVKLTQMYEITDLFIEAGATSSKKDVRRQIEAGGVYINNLRISK